MDPDLYQQIYAFEWDQRSALNSAANIPIVATTVLGGAIATMGLGYPYSSSTESLSFAMLMLTASVALGWSAYSIVRSLVSSKYKKIPSPMTLREHFANLSAWHLRNAGSIEKAEEEFKDLLNLRLAEAADANAANNEARAAYIFRATISLALALIVLGAAAVLYVRASIARSEKVHQVRIVAPIPNIQEVIMAAEKPPKPESEVPKSTAPVQAPKPPAGPAPSDPKPAFPPNIDVRTFIVKPVK